MKVTAGDGRQIATGVAVAAALALAQFVLAQNGTGETMDMEQWGWKLGQSVMAGVATYIVARLGGTQA